MYFVDILGIFVILKEKLIEIQLLEGARSSLHAIDKGQLYFFKELSFSHLISIKNPPAKIQYEQNIKWFSVYCQQGVTHQEVSK